MSFASLGEMLSGWRNKPATSKAASAKVVHVKHDVSEPKVLSIRLLGKTQNYPVVVVCLPPTGGIQIDAFGHDGRTVATTRKMRSLGAYAWAKPDMLYEFDLPALPATGFEFCLNGSEGSRIVSIIRDGDDIIASITDPFARGIDHGHFRVALKDLAAAPDTPPTP